MRREQNGFSCDDSNLRRSTAASKRVYYPWSILFVMTVFVCSKQSTKWREFAILLLLLFFSFFFCIHAALTPQKTEEGESGLSNNNKKGLVVLNYHRSCPSLPSYLIFFFRPLSFLLLLFLFFFFKSRREACVENSAQLYKLKKGSTRIYTHKLIHSVALRSLVFEIKRKKRNR